MRFIDKIALGSMAGATLNPYVWRLQVKSARNTDECQCCLIGMAAMADGREVPDPKCFPDIFEWQPWLKELVEYGFVFMPAYEAIGRLAQREYEGAMTREAALAQIDKWEKEANPDYGKEPENEEDNAEETDDAVRAVCIR